jgi:hypothetical protein
VSQSPFSERCSTLRDQKENGDWLAADDYAVIEQEHEP